MEKIRFQREVSKYVFREVPISYIERQIILEFIKELPIETLKKLFNIKKIDFEDKNLKEKSKLDYELFKKLEKLSYENKVLYEGEFIIETL